LQRPWTCFASRPGRSPTGPLFMVFATENGLTSTESHRSGVSHSRGPALCPVRYCHLARSCDSWRSRSPAPGLEQSPRARSGPESFAMTESLVTHRGPYPGKPTLQTGTLRPRGGRSSSVSDLLDTARCHRLRSQSTYLPYLRATPGDRPVSPCPATLLEPCDPGSFKSTLSD
jgi:hypothetical protein